MVVSCPPCPEGARTTVDLVGALGQTIAKLPEVAEFDPATQEFLGDWFARVQKRIGSEGLLPDWWRV